MYTTVAAGALMGAGAFGTQQQLQNRTCNDRCGSKMLLHELGGTYVDAAVKA